MFQIVLNSRTLLPESRRVIEHKFFDFVFNCDPPPDRAQAVFCFLPILPFVFEILQKGVVLKTRDVVFPISSTSRRLEVNIELRNYCVMIRELVWQNTRRNCIDVTSCIDTINPSAKIFTKTHMFF